MPDEVYVRYGDLRQWISSCGYCTIYTDFSIYLAIITYKYLFLGVTELV